MDLSLQGLASFIHTIFLKSLPYIGFHMINLKKWTQESHFENNKAGIGRALV